MKYSLKRFALYALMILAVAPLIFAAGVLIAEFRLYPHQIAVEELDGNLEVYEPDAGQTPDDVAPHYLIRAQKPYPSVIRNTAQAFQGLNLVTRVADRLSLSVMITDMDGRKLHEWVLDWFKIWPDAKHVPDRFLPRSKPGTHVNPAVLMENGDLVFTFARLGLVRIDRQGKVLWRLPYQTHHSIERDDDGNLWVCGQKEHLKPDKRFPNRIPPFAEETILLVSPERKIIREWSVAELLSKNGYHGLLYLGSLQPWTTMVSGDVLHLNDVEPFPARIKEGFFRKGDVLVSLRNNNTVFAFNRNTEKISFISIGRFVRQHDPDFIDGDTFSVLDNNVAAPERMRPQSRIAIVSAVNNTVATFFEGTPRQPFFTIVIGRHQWLPNGNLLITESCAGRAFEINRDGRVVWEYVNHVGKGTVGLIEEVQRLPTEYARLFPPKTLAAVQR